jgi:conjugative relaxase-like TrwC/TraI family protein
VLTISNPLSAGQVTSYYTKSFANAKENYYTEGDVITGQWHGRLAERWGLIGAVTKEQYDRLAWGRDPWTGEQLVRLVKGHRAGWDAVLSAPKSVSLVALVGGDNRVREAHRQSVAITLDALERYTQARIGGKHLPETTRQWVAATFEHDSARPVAGYAAPQIHTHVVVMNMARTTDGKVRAVQPWEWYRSRAFVTAVYRTELATRLKALGYEVEVGLKGEPRIKGFTQA